LDVKVKKLAAQALASICSAEEKVAPTCSPLNYPILRLSRVLLFILLDGSRSLFKCALATHGWHQ